jgi:hypothetical protein
VGSTCEPSRGMHGVLPEPRPSAPAATSTSPLLVPITAAEAELRSRPPDAKVPSEGVIEPFSPPPAITLLEVPSYRSALSLKNPTASSNVPA